VTPYKTAMSLYHNFQRVQVLPYTKGSSLTAVSPAAIKAANKAVRKELQST